ncbi:MAG TPA: FixH family protein [Casimicrobiaceae bacterium]|jgi:hypothetical protein|nr:FixH family protein [Casimicrobiaceae bacterium]
MSRRASSFPADPPPWYRERWPWLLMAGPFAVIVAALASAWLAARSDDGLVAQDYYRQGLLINRKLQQPLRPAQALPAAMLRVASDRTLRVRLRNVAEPTALAIVLVPHGDRARSVRLPLARASEEWTGVLPALEAGTCIVVLEAPDWRLPVTVATLPFAELELGGGPHS